MSHPFPPFYTVIATTRRGKLLDRTLTSLANCTLPTNYAGTIIVENGEKGDAEKVITPFLISLSIEYHYVSEANKSRALNAIIPQLSPNAFLFFTDDDVRFAQDTLMHYMNALQQHKHGVFMGGRLEIDYESPPPEWLVPFLLSSARGWEWLGKSKLGVTETFLGANWGAFLADILAVGGFDADYGPGSQSSMRGQESVMQNRMYRAGIRPIYLPNACIWHYVPAERCTPDWVLTRVQNTTATVSQMRIEQMRGMKRVLYALAIAARLSLRFSLHVVRPKAVSMPVRFRRQHRIMADIGRIRGIALYFWKQ